MREVNTLNILSIESATANFNFRIYSAFYVNYVGVYVQMMYQKSDDVRPHFGKNETSSPFE